MTVTYSATKSFLWLLPIWHGSVWKAVWFQYVVFLSMYYIINLCYRFAMPPAAQDKFEGLVHYFQRGHGFIPIQFLLGFYVSNVVSQWRDQLNCIAWPDKLLIFLVGNMDDDDEEAKKIRRTFMRYCNLLSVLVWKEISLKIKKRFPTDRHLVKAGLLTEKEYERYMNASGKYGRWFIPVSWMVSLINRCRREGRISDFATQSLLQELWSFRSGSAMLTFYDWVNIPLVYTQVVTLATYGYFAFSLLGRQTLKTSEIDLYFPLFTTLEFLFYIGWLKVGEQLRCPFGEDDEDFDMNYILDRNIYVSNMLVDELRTQPVEPEQNEFWDEKDPHLPHTKASIKVKDRIPPWRLGKWKLKEKDMELVEETVPAKKNKKRRTLPPIVKFDSNLGTQVASFAGRAEDPSWRIVEADSASAPMFQKTVM